MRFGGRIKCLRTCGDKSYLPPGFSDIVKTISKEKGFRASHCGRKIVDLGEFTVTCGNP